MMNPTDSNQIRKGEFDREAGVPELMNQIDHAVFQVNSRQAQNEWRNGIQKGAGAVGKPTLGPNSVIDGFQDLIVGLQSRRVLGFSAFIEFADIHVGRIHVLVWVREYLNMNPIPNE
jgi:hypothetical protein